MPPKRKNTKKPPNIAEILKTVQTLNGNKEDVGSTTAKDIEEFLCRKVTVAKFVNADPNLIKNLIDDSVAQSKIIPVSVNDSIEYRTGKMIGDDRSKVLHYRGDIPGPSYFQLLKNAYNLTRQTVGNKSDSKGITSQEWLDWLHKDSKFLNYDLEIFNKNLIPLGIKRGHIIEVNPSAESKSDDQNEKTQYYQITDHFLSYYKLFRRNRIMALQALTNADNGDSNELLFAKNVSETSGMDGDDSDMENDNDNSIDADTSAINLDSSQPSTVATNNDMELKKDLDNVTVDSKPTIRKEPPTPSSNPPQRVSQRKRFKKTLGPDFVESDTVMMYESSNHSRTRYSQSSSNQSSTSNQSVSQTSSSNSKSNPSPKSQSVATKSAPLASVSVSASVSSVQPNEETKPLPTSDLVPAESGAESQDQSSIYGRWLPSVELCFICKQPYKRCKRYSYIISCQECGCKAHGTCFRTFIGNQLTTNWICTECRPDSVCQICNIVERKPDFYLVCQKCSAPYHAHCWREKGHAVCQKCKVKFTKLTIPSSLTPKSEPVQSESSPKTLSPKVTSTFNNSKVIASKSNSLLQSNVGESTVSSALASYAVPSNSASSSCTVPSNSASSSCAVPSNSASASCTVPSNSASFQLNGKSLIEKPLLTTKVSRPKIVINQNDGGNSETTNTVTVDAVKIFQNTNSEETQVASKTPTIPTTTPETKDDHPPLLETIKVEEPTIIETIKQSKSTSSKMNPKILDPLLKNIKTEQINNQNCNNTQQINNPNSRKSITMNPSSMYEKRPAQAICYNFQTWLETELKPNRPYDDLTPLSSLPNAINEWTSEEVHRFITTIGHPNEADRFLEKEIDGLTVLLLTREDLLNALSLKIGPALKLLGYLNRLHEEMQQ